MAWDELLLQATSIIENRETYQRSLGQLASKVAEEYGQDRLKDFSREIKENYGLIISTSTLKNYRWVWEKTKELKLPEDLSYRTLQYIASSGNPEYWAERITKEGLTSPQVFKLMREEKGLPSKKRAYICKACGASNLIG